MSYIEKEIKIESFTDLQTWKEGHVLVVAIYKETNLFPQTVGKLLTGLIKSGKRM